MMIPTTACSIELITMDFSVIRQDEACFLRILKHLEYWPFLGGCHSLAFVWQPFLNSSRRTGGRGSSFVVGPRSRSSAWRARRDMSTQIP